MKGTMQKAHFWSTWGGMSFWLGWISPPTNLSCRPSFSCDAIHFPLNNKDHASYQPISLPSLHDLIGICIFGILGPLTLEPWRIWSEKIRVWLLHDTVCCQELNNLIGFCVCHQPGYHGRISGCVIVCHNLSWSTFRLEPNRPSPKNQRISRLLSMESYGICQRLLADFNHYYFVSFFLMMRQIWDV
jgi:hypothetical protein